MIRNIPKEQSDILETICQKIYDKKGQNVITIDVRGVCTITDYFIVAEGNVERHVKALSNAITDALLEQHRKPYHAEGQAVGDWVVLDYGEVIVHLLISDMRERYAIEQVWKEGKIVDVPVHIAVNS